MTNITKYRVCSMNEVSIIINGVRYDAVENFFPKDCYGCDLADYCDKLEFGGLACSKVIGDNKFFKKSDKKFER